MPNFLRAEKLAKTYRYDVNCKKKKKNNNNNNNNSNNGRAA